MNFTNLTLDKVGSGYTLVATSSGLGPATTNAIHVTVGPADHLAIPAGGEPPASVTAAGVFGMTVDVVDKGGNIVTNYSGSVTISQPGAIAGTTTVTVSNGVATFNNLHIDTPGTYTLVATATGLTSATSTTVTVNSSTLPAKLVWATQPPGQVTRRLHLQRVARRGGFGRQRRDELRRQRLDRHRYQSRQRHAGRDPHRRRIRRRGDVHRTLTLSADGNGYTLIASTSNNVQSPDSNRFDVSAIPPVLLDITVEPPASIQDTTPIGLTVEALDAAGVADPDFNGDMTVSISSPAGSNALVGTTTVSAVAGVATFSGLNLTELGNFVLKVSCTGLAPVTTGTVNVVAGAASQLTVVVPPPDSVPAGNAFSFQVEAQDQYGNLATSYHGTIAATLAANPAGATFVGSPTQMANQGLATFTGLKVLRAGSGYTINVTDAPNSLSSSTTTGFGVTPNTPTILIYSTPPPSNATAGNPFGLTVGVADMYGNVVPSYTGNVTVAVPNKPAPGPLGGVVTEPLNGGLAIFSGLLLDNVASNYTLLATAPASQRNLRRDRRDGRLARPTGRDRAAARQRQRRLPVRRRRHGRGRVRQPHHRLHRGGLAQPPRALRAAAPRRRPPHRVGRGRRRVLPADDRGRHGRLGPHHPGLEPRPGDRQLDPDDRHRPDGHAPRRHRGAAARRWPPAARFGLVVAAEDQFGNINAGFNGTIVITLPAGAGASLGGTTQLAASGGVASFQGLSLSQTQQPRLDRRLQLGIRQHVDHRHRADRAGRGDEPDLHPAGEDHRHTGDHEQAAPGDPDPRHLQRCAEPGAGGEPRRVQADHRGQEELIHRQECQADPDQRSVYNAGSTR